MALRWPDLLGRRAARGLGSTGRLRGPEGLAHRLWACCSGLPPRLLLRVAQGLGWADLLLRRAQRHAAHQQIDLLLGAPRGPHPRASLLRTARAVTWHAHLLAGWRQRCWPRRLAQDLARTAQRVRGRAPTVLVAHVGLWPLAEAALAESACRALDLERAPVRGAQAAWVPFLGRLAAVDLRPLRRALRRGGALWLMLVLPDAQGRPFLWLSPDLRAAARDGLGDEAAGLAAAAYGALGLVVRAAPELMDWGWPRLTLRPTPTLAGHALSSRWAAWKAHGRRARRRARPAR